MQAMAETTGKTAISHVLLVAVTVTDCSHSQCVVKVGWRLTLSFL